MTDESARLACGTRAWGIAIFTTVSVFTVSHVKGYILSTQKIGVASYMVSPE